MLEIQTNGNLGKFNIKLPTKLSEITEDYLNRVTEGIEVAPNYSLIGICYREKLSTVILSVRQRKKQIDTPVVPIFIKAGENTSDFISNINTGNRIIISGSNIALGNHVSTPNNNITINKVLEFIDGDSEIYKEAMKHNDYCYFLEFKLVPNCNIIGCYKNLNVASFEDPFISKIIEIEE